jgi:hypothetical protein
MIKKLLFFFLSLVSFTSFSQNPTLSNEATVSVFTCGKGNELYTVFGHTAIRIKDSINNLDVVYNYGAFDFRTENFYLKFVKGDLQYFIGASSYEDFVYEYQYEKREVIEQFLDFPTAKKQELYDKLNASLFSEDRNYIYKFIDRNCTTMVVEKINETIGKNLIKKVDDTSISYREVLYPYFENHFWNKLGINIIFGAKTDNDAEKLFLPIELLNSLDKASINGKPLVYKKETIIKGSEPAIAFSFINSIYFVSLLLLIIALINNKSVFIIYFIILGLLGLFFSLVGFYSFHKELLWNYNTMLFNPLYIVLPFIRNQKTLKKLIVFCGIVLLGYCIVMINKPHLPLVIPFITVTFYALWKMNATVKFVK